MKYFLSITLVVVTYLSTEAQLKVAGLTSSSRAQTCIERAEGENWKEDISKRQLHYAEYITNDNRKIGFNSVELVNYFDAHGNLQPLDIRFTQKNDYWISDKRPVAIKVDKKGKVSLHNENNSFFTCGLPVSINGIHAFNFSNSEFNNGTSIRFNGILNGIDKSFDATSKGVKSAYILNTRQSTTGSNFVIKEKYTLPKNCKIVCDVEHGQESGQYWNGNLKIINSTTNEEIGNIFNVVCYDQNGSAIQGLYKFTNNTDNTAIVEMAIPSTWLNATERQYPVIIDPLVTGPTTTWGGSYINSCFFPAYSADSINVIVPGGITVTKLWITASFYANPFTTTVMGDGRMYFSTSCGQSTIFSVSGPTSLSPGTAYLDHFDIHSPLMCCYPQNCSSFSFWLSFHISRTTNGPGCNATYLYYDPFGTSWPFSAYVDGYTAETYGTEMQMIPSSICANTCSFNAKIYAHYGVPPFTFTHPWSSDTIVGGTPNGCNTGSSLQTLTLDVPVCPNYCDTATSLAIPAPLVVDACGTVLTGFDPFYYIGIKPVPTITFDTDSIKICSGEIVMSNLTSCLPGAMITWTGNGLTGTNNVTDTIFNTSNSISSTNYLASVTMNGCNGIGDTLVVQTWPYAIDDFTFTNDTLIINQPVNFTNNSLLNQNDLVNWIWTFGDSSFSFLQNPVYTYTDTGTYTVCLYVVTQMGCNDTLCKTVYVINNELLLPNIITPNGDAINDCLFIKSLEYYPINKVTVFNRWGQIVFEKENYKNDWNAKGISDGAYYYFLEIPNMKIMKSVLEIVRK